MDTIELKQDKAALKQKDVKIEQKEELVYQIVSRMVQKGMSLQSIQEITDFNKEEIEKIIKILENYS
jgi:hypothetical protein